MGKARGDCARLSEREREVVQCVARGLRDKQIAETLFISVQTVKNHLQHIFDKLYISDRVKLALFALQQGLDVDDGSCRGPGTLDDLIVVDATFTPLNSTTVEERVVADAASPTARKPSVVKLREAHQDTFKGAGDMVGGAVLPIHRAVEKRKGT